MAQRPQRPCRALGCRELHRNGNGYCDAHQDMAAAWGGSRRASASERGYGAAWRRQRKAALQRDYHQCRPCAAKGAVTYGNEVDHIIPKFQGGTDDLENLQTICKDCHDEKTRRESSWRRVGGV
ncbi:HNH endonuclease [Alcaligenes nematophilus]